MFQYSIGITALNISQFAIDTVSHNIANANTPGYHRRQALLQALPEYRINGRFFGAGVGLAQFRQVRDGVLENSLTGVTADSATLEQQLHSDRRIESLLGRGPGSLEELLTQFQSSVTQLSTHPAEQTQRRLVLESADRLTGQVRQTAGRLSELRGDVRQQIQSEVASLNAKLAELASIHGRIQTTYRAHISGDIIDRRDQLINEIAGIMDVDRNEVVNNGLGIAVGGGTISVGVLPQTVTVHTADDGTISLKVGQTSALVTPRGGRMAALLAANNGTIAGFEDRLDGIARNLMGVFDQAHARGIGPNGPFSRLISTRTVESTTTPLSSAGLALPVSAGRLYLTVTDSAGERRTTGIDYDPASDSLADIATRISGINGVHATVNAPSGTLNIQAKAGWRFDFTGRTDTRPDLATFTGTSTPRLSGNWTGTANEQYRIEIAGTGEVGVTEGLLANVFNEAGELVAEISLGSKYEPGQPVLIGNGVSVAFGAGTVNHDEGFTTEMVANSDTGGILSALGLNSFFTGSGSADIAVSDRLTGQPDLLATGVSGDAGDATNLLRLMEAMTRPVEGQLDVAAALTGLSVEAGSRVETGSILADQLIALKTRYENDRDSHSGVDLNEELINMSRYQKAFEASLRVIQAIDAMFDEANRLLG